MTAPRVGELTLDEEIRELLREQNKLLRRLVATSRAANRAMLTTAAAARALGRRHGDVLAWVAEGRLRTVDVDGAERVPRSEIERLQREGLPEKQTRKRAASGESLRGFKP
jgi:hypothetical protein